MNIICLKVYSVNISIDDKALEIDNYYVYLSELIDTTGKLENK